MGHTGQTGTARSRSNVAQVDWFQGWLVSEATA